MNRLYFNTLTIFLIFIFLVNLLSSLISSNANQMYNYAYYRQRVTAITYLMKNIIIESGVNLNSDTTEELVDIVEYAAHEYNIDKLLLLLLVDPKKQYEFDSIGGIGLTSIPFELFYKTNFSDPYIAKQNIMAAAFSIKALMDKGIAPKDLIMKFYMINEDVKTLAPDIYERVLILSNEYEKLLE